MRPGAMFAACLAVVALLSAAAGQVSADDDESPRVVWMWVDRHGTTGYTDDPKRIPLAYRAGKGEKPIDWPRVTVDRVDKDKRREALRARLEALRNSGPAGCRCTR